VSVINIAQIHKIVFEIFLLAKTDYTQTERTEYTISRCPE